MPVPVRFEEAAYTYFSMIVMGGVKTLSVCVLKQTRPTVKPVSAALHAAPGKLELS